MSVTVYGASDDLIEVDGAVSEEFPLHDDDEGDLLAFSNGVILRVCYSKSGVWRITRVVGDAEWVSIEQAPEDDEDNYTDRATVNDSVAWVVHGIAWAK
jgi:hypothetical protein